MKITCPSCSSQYDVDAKRAASGGSMKCPSCGEPIDFSSPSAAAPAPEPEASIPLALDFDVVDLPAPVEARGAKPAAHSEPAIELVDLPAPKSIPLAKSPPSAPVAAPPIALAVSTFGSDEDLIDLPAPAEPRATQPHQDVAVDLLAPKGPSRPAPPTKPAPPFPPSIGLATSAPSHNDDEGEELDGLDLVEDGLEVAPKADAPTLGLSLDEPELDDLPAPKSIGGVTLELAPKGADPDGSSIAPKAESTDLAPANLDVSPVRPGDSGKPVPSTRVSSTPPPPLGTAPPAGFVPMEESKNRKRLALYAGAGGALILVLVGVGLGLFTSAGYFGARILNGERAAEGTSLQKARRLLSDDTIANYQKAVTDLDPHVATATDPALIGVSAQATYALARLGASGTAADAHAADMLLARFDSNEEAGHNADLLKARALRSLIGGHAAEAKTQLDAVLSAAPADASALTYLGWTLFEMGDLVGARDAYSRAAAAEPTRVAALYGAALSGERLGEANVAGKYRAVLALSKDHFRAQVGIARLDKNGKALTALIDSAAGRKAGKRELADAWTSLGVLALAGARRDEARDLLRKAATLYPGSPVTEVALGEVLCDLGQADAALASLHKLVVAQPKNLDARLALVRALLEGHGDGLRDEAVSTLAPAIAAAPKDARVLYWEGRVALSATPPDKTGALAKLTAALAADPKLIPAYLAQARTLASLGRTDDAVAALTKAGQAVAGDPQLLAALGDGYASLNRYADAEAQYRAALAVDGTQWSTMLALGHAQEAQGNIDGAQATYEAVRSKATNVTGATEALARLLAKRGKMEDAWLLFRTALAEIPHPSTELRLAAAQAAFDTKRFEETQKLVDSVLKDDDRSVLGLILGAKLALESSHADDGLILARRAASISDMPEGHLVLGQTLEKLGKLDAAASEYQLAKQPANNSSSGEAGLGHARIMVHMGATKDALAELQTLTHDARLRAPALLLMGDCLSDLQQTDRARHAYEDAVKADPELGEAAFKYARALHDASRRQPAVEMLDRALKLGGPTAPYRVDALLLLGDVHRELKQNGEAVRAYKQYLEVAPADAPDRVEVTRQIGLLDGNPL